MTVYLAWGVLAFALALGLYAVNNRPEGVSASSQASTVGYYFAVSVVCIAHIMGVR